MPRPPNHLLLLLLVPIFALLPGALVRGSPLPSSSRERMVLAPKIQKELAKALEALRQNRLPEARKHLDVVHLAAPGDTETNFLLGIYWSQMKAWEQAQSFLEKALLLSPNHLGALLTLGAVLLQEERPAEAARYFRQAVDAEPTSWRAHAALADACMRQGLFEESIHEAERALELGHGQAEIVLPLLARALQLQGEEQEAALVFQRYLQAHTKDASSQKLLESLPDGFSGQDFSEALAALTLTPPVQVTTSLLFSNWLPPDIDEIVPPVQPGITCNLEEVLRQSGKRVEEFVASVDKFTATETVIHESINRFGLASKPKTFEFDYLVSIKENRPGLLSVEEYRNSHYHASDFPDGIATTGLPALMLIFHPFYARNFSMTCEGLARSKGQAAWQVYFRQRPDHPSGIRTYQSGGPQGPIYAAPLKGRAWIAADSFQIVRLEAGIINPLPQIRLVADRAAIEYGSVHFRTQNRYMWLPQTAEVFYDWRGRHSHRRHTFENYLLYSVDDKQRISVPDAVAPAVRESTPKDSGPRSKATFEAAAS
jgi:tetratricopeptide (TPR) repeat protein